MTGTNTRAVRFASLAGESLERVVELAKKICLIPSPTGEEEGVGRFVADQFTERGLRPEIDEVGNVIVRREGAGAAGTLMIAAHMDTVFPAGTPLHVARDGDKITGPGIGDNSLGVAALIALAELLDAAGIRTPGDLLLVADVGEEGLGNLRGMRAVVNRFEPELGAVIALEGHGLGRVLHQAVATRRIRITVTGPGGHGFSCFGRPSAVHAIAGIVHRIAGLDVPSEPRTTYNVGLIEGGLSVNSIAPSASASVDLRSTDPEALDALTGRVESIAHAASSDSLRVGIDNLGDRPGGLTPPDARIVRAATEAVESLGLEVTGDPGSTDANIPISRGIPAVCLGMTRCVTGAHRVDETIEIPPIVMGLRQLLEIVDRFPVAG